MSVWLCEHISQKKKMTEVTNKVFFGWTNNIFSFML